MRSALLQRLAPAPPLDEFLDTLRPPTRAARLEVCPPQAGRSRPWLAIVRDWLTDGWQGQASVRRAPRPGRVARGALPLDAIRQEFIESIDGIRTAAADELADRIHFARSLRELWHLRAEIFSLVSLHHDQAEADERLAWLNRHFPTRSPRSGFGALTSKDMWP
jgi:hypothetical protein